MHAVLIREIKIMHMHASASYDFRKNKEIRYVHVILRPIESKVFPDLDYLWPKEARMEHERDSPA
jgi:hypothetical protein